MNFLELAEARAQFRDTLRMLQLEALKIALNAPCWSHNPSRYNWLQGMNPDEYIGRGRILEEQK